MQDIKITKNCYLPKENVKFYMEYKGKTITDYVKALKKDNTNKVFDMTNGKKTLSVIFLKSGEVLLIPTAIETLKTRMNTQGDN